MPLEQFVSAGTVIIGASQAGLQVAASLRDLGEDGPITLVGAEPHAPYERPPLSKAFLAGTVDVRTLSYRNPAWYAENHIDLVQGDRVAEVVLDGDGGAGTATTASGRTLPFDRLALTVGAAPRRLDLPGADLDGVCYLRDIEDAANLRSRLEKADHVVVVGGGFIGLEAASVARSQGRSVTVVEAEERLIPRAVAPVVSEFYRGAHERRGTNVVLSIQACAFDGDGGAVCGVELGDGSRLRADVVLVGVGIVPRTQLAEQLGLECDGGIVVDVDARTCEPSVVAAGDCTVLPNPMTGHGRVRLESVQNAVDQARAASHSLVGRPQGRVTVPWFWSDQADLKLQIAGLSTGYDDFVLRGDPATEQFSVLYYEEGRLIAVDAVNTPRDYIAVRAALGKGMTIPADRAADPDVALKTLLTSPATT